jgi:hypothetical protein
MQRGFAAIQRVEVPHQPLQPGMARIVQRAPVELGIVVPFAACPNSCPMNNSFFPGCPHMNP